MLKRIYLRDLESVAREGLAQLQAMTPKDTGKTAASWEYEIEDSADSWKIVWLNTNVINGVNIAIILDKGHGTRNGGYVQGRDYIDPALVPVFEKLADKAWEKVTKL